MVSLACGSAFWQKKSENGKKKKTAWTDCLLFAVFVMLSSFPGLPTKSFLKFILHSKENDNVMKFQFRFAWNVRSSPAFGQRTSVDQLAQLSAAPINGFFSWRGLFQQRELEIHSFSAGMQRRGRFSFRQFQKASLRDRTCLEKDTNECSCLICDSSCCRTSCVSVQPCTPKVLPNTETFLHSRVFFVTCVVPALCQIMHAPEVVIQLQNDLGRYLARTT